MSDRGTDWYKREPRAFLEGVRRLTEREIAVYAVVLDLIYDGGHQTLNDPKHIASYFADIGVAAVRHAIERLCDAGKLEIDGEYLTNKRARNEGKTRRQLSELRRNAGRLGGVSSAKSRAKPNDDKGLSEAHGSANLKQASSLEGEGEGEGEKKETLGASAPIEPAAPDPFEAFWQVYPKRDGANPRKPAKAKFEKLVRDGTDPDLIVSAARRLAARHPKPTPYVPQATRWLNEERFHDDASPPPASDLSDDDWRKRLDHARRTGNWSTTRWGPFPGQPGCLVPPALLQPGDGEGWADKGLEAASAPSRQFKAA